MNNYGIGGKKKTHIAVKIIIAAVIAAAAALYVIGLTLGSDSEARTAVSEAVEENSSLRREIEEKDARIAELEERVKALEDEAARYTPAPTPYTPQLSSAPEENGTDAGERGSGVRSPRDE